MIDRYIYSEKHSVDLFEVKVLPEDLQDEFGYSSFNPVFNAFSRLAADRFPDKNGIVGGHDNVYEVFFKDKERAPKRFAAHVRLGKLFGNVFIRWASLAKSEKSDLMDYVHRGQVTVYFMTHIDIEAILEESAK